MRKALGFTMIALLVSAASLLAEEKTWTGKISDSMCGRSHKSAIEHAGKKLSDTECVNACIEKGAKYVLVAGGKVYNIENQDLADLKAHAGHSVKLTGEMTGDTIKVSKIAM
jgi:hypothetical protein